MRRMKNIEKYPFPNAPSRGVRTIFAHRMKSLLKNIQLVVAIFVTLASCTTHQELAYISDAQRDTAQAILHTYANTIHKGDVLYIYVAAKDVESTIPFNQETNHLFQGDKEFTQINGALISALRQKQELEKKQENKLVQNEAVNEYEREKQRYEEYLKKIYQSGRATILASADGRKSGKNVAGYLVDNQGYIHFPVLGSMQVEGLAHDTLSFLIRQQLEQADLVNDPTVTCELMNFRVSVIGEVAKPDQIHVDGNRLTLLEALAIAGDLTIYGQRENVTIVRETNGQYQVGQVDLTSKTLFESPFYYLQQNDVVYVEPNDKKKKEYGHNDYLMQYIGMGVGVANIGLGAIRILVQLERQK